MHRAVGHTLVARLVYRTLGNLRSSVDFALSLKLVRLRARRTVDEQHTDGRFTDLQGQPQLIG